MSCPVNKFRTTVAAYDRNYQSVFACAPHVALGLGDGVRLKYLIVNLENQFQVTTSHN